MFQILFHLKVFFLLYYFQPTKNYQLLQIFLLLLTKTIGWIRNALLKNLFEVPTKVSHHYLFPIFFIGNIFNILYRTHKKKRFFAPFYFLDTISSQGDKQNVTHWQNNSQCALNIQMCVRDSPRQSQIVSNSPRQSQIATDSHRQFQKV